MGQDMHSLGLMQELTDILGPRLLLTHHSALLNTWLPPYDLMWLPRASPHICILSGGKAEREREDRFFLLFLRVPPKSCTHHFLSHDLDLPWSHGHGGAAGNAGKRSLSSRAAGLLFKGESGSGGGTSSSLPHGWLSVFLFIFHS